VFVLNEERDPVLTFDQMKTIDDVRPGFMHGDWDLEVLERTPGMRYFAVLPRRWIVKRTFGRLSHNRRTSKDDASLWPGEEAAWARNKHKQLSPGIACSVSRLASPSCVRRME
jgi:hypothetical protein